MAFRDQNGKITIDEVAARNDVKRLGIAKEHLKTSLDIVKQINQQATEFSGDTGKTIEETSWQLLIQIGKMIEMTDGTIEEINQTVSKYQAIDKKLKETMESFGGL